MIYRVLCFRARLRGKLHTLVRKLHTARRVLLHYCARKGRIIAGKRRKTICREQKQIRETFFLTRLSVSKSARLRLPRIIEQRASVRERRLRTRQGSKRAPVNNASASAWEAVTRERECRFPFRGKPSTRSDAFARAPAFLCRSLLKA